MIMWLYHDTIGKVGLTCVPEALISGWNDSGANLLPYGGVAGRMAKRICKENGKRYGKENCKENCKENLKENRKRYDHIGHGR